MMATACLRITEKSADCVVEVPGRCVPRDIFSASRWGTGIHKCVSAETGPGSDRAGGEARYADCSSLVLPASDVRFRRAGEGL